jgi:hypothetical protein
LSSTLPPPPPPPSGPPGGPTGGPPEYLESGGGAPAPREPRSGGSPAKRALLAGGGIVGLAAVGVGAWAAYGFFSTGPQPAQALPAATLGYASVDLDPSGGQKIEALRTLNKFPAFKDYVGINPNDDLRKELFDKIQDEADCDDIDYGDDIEPWLGDRAAVAAVDLGGDTPDAVVVLQVKDADKADAGLDKIKACSGAGDEESDGGWAIEGDWAVIAESDAVADKVVAATKKGSLADDGDFKKWTGEAGDPGVVTLYAGPRAGDYLADHADDMFGFPFGLISGVSGGTDATSATSCEINSETGESSCVPMCSNGDDYDDSGDSPDGTTDPTTLPPCDAPDPTSMLGSGLSEDLKQKFRDFEGMAATLRFDDGAIELESAGDGSMGTSFLSGGGTADVVKSLPSDTGAVLGIGFKEGWFGDIIDYVAPYVGEDADQVMSDLADATGLDLPADAETLAGDSAALALGSDFDPESFFSSGDGSDLPIALKVKGDPAEIEKVLDKLRDMAGPEANVLESDSDGDVIVIGPNADFRADVLKDGGLGDNRVFKDVVREADKAQTVLFIDVDEFQDAIDDAAGESDEEFVDNLEPVAGFGVVGWLDGDVAHAVARLTTD